MRVVEWRWYRRIFGSVYRLCQKYHEDVIKWKHFPRYLPFVRGIHRSPVNSPHKASDAELRCFLWPTPAWNSSWVNNGDARDLRRHRTHYDVTVMTNRRLERFPVIDNINPPLAYWSQCSAEVLEKMEQMTHDIGKYGDIGNFSGVSSITLTLVISKVWGHGPLPTKYLGTFLILLC